MELKYVFAIFFYGNIWQLSIFSVILHAELGELYPYKI